MKDLKTILESLDDNSKEEFKKELIKEFNLFIKYRNAADKRLKIFINSIPKGKLDIEDLAYITVMETIHKDSIKNIKTKYKELFGEEFVEPTFNEIDFED